MVSVEPRVRLEWASKPRLDKPHVDEGRHLNIHPRVVIEDAACNAHWDRVTVTVTREATMHMLEDDGASPSL